MVVRHLTHRHVLAGATDLRARFQRQPNHDSTFALSLRSPGSRRREKMGTETFHYY